MYGVASYQKSLNNTISVVQMDIEDSIIIKDKIPKVCEKFGEFSGIFFSRFPIYKTICNTFETSVYTNKNWKLYLKQLTDLLTVSFSIDDNDIMNYLLDKNFYRFYVDIRKYLVLRGLKVICRLIKSVNKNSSNLGLIITSGKEEILSIYLSLISILYGMRASRDGKFILYYQDYYNAISLDNIIVSSIKRNIKNDMDIVISFRFYNKKYINFSNFLSYKEFAENGNLIVSFVDNILNIEDFDFLDMCLIDNNSDMTI